MALESLHKLGKRVKYEGRVHKGKGTITEIKDTKRGVRVYVTDKSHPKGGLWLHQTHVKGY